jgi:hypothetical protein
MTALYGGLKRIYKRVVPPVAQQLTWSHRYPLWRVFEPAKALLLRKGASHDDIYDQFYFEETVEGRISASAPVITTYIIDAQRDRFRT